MSVDRHSEALHDLGTFQKRRHKLKWSSRVPFRRVVILKPIFHGHRHLCTRCNYDFHKINMNTRSSFDISSWGVRIS